MCLKFFPSIYKTSWGLLFFVNAALAQSPADSLQEQEEEIDTVRVKKKVFVSKTVYAPPLKKENIFFISAYVGAYTDKSYYNVCESCKSYFDSVQAATSFALSYTYGLQIAYSPKKWYLALGASSAHYRSRFNFTDSIGQAYNTINALNSIDFNFAGGYWFRKEKQGLSYMALGGLSYALLNSVSGSTLSRENSGRVVDLKDEIAFSPTQISINATLRLLYPLFSKVKAFGDLFYAYDVKTIIKANNEFVQQRNMYGLKLGLMYRFK
jgi:hypothetical protein